MASPDTNSNFHPWQRLAEGLLGVALLGLGVAAILGQSKTAASIAGKF